MRCYDSIAFNEVIESVGIAFVVGIQTVEIHHPQQRLVTNRVNRQILYGCTSRIAEVFDVQFEILFLYLISTQRINVFHHQVPVGKLRRNRRTFQQFQIKRLVGICYITGEFADLINRTLIGIFISHRKNLICIQGRIQRNVTQCFIQTIFGRRKQTCTFYLFIVASTLNAISRQRVQSLCHLTNITRIRIVGLDFSQKIVRRIPGIIGSRVSNPMRIGQNLIFRQVHESDNVSRLIIRSPAVRNPHLNSRDVYTGRYIRQFRGKLVIVVPKEVSQEKVTVFIIIIHTDGERRRLRPTLSIDSLGF